MGFGGQPQPVHGPFADEDLGSGEKRRRLKGKIQRAIGNGRCKCEMCEDRDRKVGMPENEMWSRRPGEEGEIYIAQGPEVAGVLGQRRPWEA